MQRRTPVTDPIKNNWWPQRSFLSVPTTVKCYDNITKLTYTSHHNTSSVSNAKHTYRNTKQAYTYIEQKNTWPCGTEQARTLTEQTSYKDQNARPKIILHAPQCTFLIRLQIHSIHFFRTPSIFRWWQESKLPLMSVSTPLFSLCFIICVINSDFTPISSFQISTWIKETCLEQ